MARQRAERTRKTYAEKLKDPRWQKRRLAVLERAEWACEGCGATDKTLHVHHGMYYGWNHDPWDYPMSTLWSLCKDCHEQAEDFRADLYHEIACLNPVRLGPHRVVSDAEDEADSFRRGDLIRANFATVKALLAVNDAHVVEALRRMQAKLPGGQR